MGDGVDPSMTIDPLLAPVYSVTHNAMDTSHAGADTHGARHLTCLLHPHDAHDATMDDPKDPYVALAAVGDQPAALYNDDTSPSSSSPRTSSVGTPHVSVHGWICDSGANKHYNSIRDEMLDLDETITGWVSGLGVPIKGKGKCLIAMRDTRGNIHNMTVHDVL